MVSEYATLTRDYGPGSGSSAVLVGGPWFLQDHGAIVVNTAPNNAAAFPDCNHG